MRRVKTRALRLTVGAYEDGTWNCTAVEDTYDHGVMINSSLIAIVHGPEDKIRVAALMYLDRMLEDERQRVAEGREASDPSV